MIRRLLRTDVRAIAREAKREIVKALEATFTCGSPSRPVAPSSGAASEKWAPATCSTTTSPTPGPTARTC